MSDVSAHRLPDDRSLRFVPTDASVIAMTLQAQEGSQAQPDVVAPRAARAHLRPLDETELLDAAVVVLYRPRVAGKADALQVAHLDAAGGPHLNVAVCGDYLEDADQPEAFEPDHAAAVTDLDFTDRTQALTVGVHLAVTLQAGQPGPAERANQLQVFQPRVPAIKNHALGRKAPFVRLLEHRLEVVV